MKLLKIIPWKILMILSLFILVYAGPGSAAVEIAAGGLSINGETFVVKGVGYSPVPIGVDPETTAPYGDYFTPYYSKIYERDLPLLRQMGANTVRITIWDNTADHTDFLNRAFNNGIQPIYVIITFRMNPSVYPDISTTIERERIKSDFRMMVSAYKNHPAVLMWSIGNGLNIPEMYGDRPDDLFTLINEMAQDAHLEEGINYHPVTTPLADNDIINTISAHEPLTTDIDLWGVNVYRGASFGTFFADFKTVSAKPLIIMEFGIDAYNGKAGGEYEYTGKPYQATYAQSLWKEIEANGDVSVGGVIRSYSDGWWLGKYGETAVGCPDNDPASHSICGQLSNSDTDGYINYEWSGLMRPVKDGSNVDAMEPRAVYSTLWSLWSASAEVLQSAFESAEADWKAQRWEWAIAKYRKIIADSPTSSFAAQAHLKLGTYYSYTMGEQDAIAEYENAVRISSGTRTAWEAKAGMAAMHHLMGDYSGARNLFREVLRETTDWDLVKLATYRMKEIDRFQREIQLGLDNAAQTIAQCGAKALTEVFKIKGKDIPLQEISNALEVNNGYVSMADIKKGTESFGLKATGVRLEKAGELKDMEMPLIAHLRSNHFVVVTSLEENTLKVIDPDLGEATFPEEVFLDSWSGYALIFGEQRKSASSPVSEDELKNVRGGHHLHGNNLGGPEGNPPILFDSSPSSINGDSCTGMPGLLVNLSNLNLLVRDTDCVYGSRGPAVSVRRAYNFDDPYEGAFGRSWMSNYEVYLTENPDGSVDVKRESGKLDHFINNAGVYDPPVWVYDKLTKNPDGTFALLIKGSKITQHFDANKKLVSITDRNNNTVTLQYNGNSKLSSVTDATTPGRTTSFTYGANGKVSMVTDPVGRKAYYYYDAYNNLTRTVDFAGNEVTYSYNTSGYIYMTAITTAKGTTQITSVCYDTCDYSGFDRIVQSITDPLLNTRTYRVGSTRLYVDDAEQHTWTYAVNASYGETTEITDPLGNKVDRGLDNYGNINSITDPKGNVTTLTYDANGNITAINDPLNNHASFAYDAANDNLTSFTDPALNVYSYIYDQNSNLTSATDAENGVVSLIYNPYGEVNVLTDARGKSTNFTYDASSGNMTQAANPIGGTDGYTYDGVGRVVSHTGPDNKTTTFTYDGIDRVKTVTYWDGTKATLTYDCCGMTKVMYPSSGGGKQTLTFTYNNANRLTGFTNAYGKNVSYGYDKNGNLKTLTYPGGKVVTYTYDAANRLTGVTDWLGNSTTYEYDAAYRLTKATRPDGSVEIYQYDNAGRLTSTLDYKSDASVVSMYTYTMDPSGNRTGAESYQPDNTQPPSQNIAYTYNDDNRLMSAGAAAFTYDVRGNLLTKTGSTYTWNVRNLLNTVTTGGSTYTYKYDPIGNRIARIVGSTETRYVVAGGTLLAETNKQGAITAYYVYGLGLISKVMPSGSAYYYHYDNIGSTIAITNQSGATVNKYAYDSFGKVLSQTEGISNPFKYVGAFGVMDEGNGLLFMRARYYDPSTGRFISKDPIGWAGGLNLYGYTGNNPVNWVDPSGLQSNQSWAQCYTNCINTLAPGFSQFFVGSQLAGNLPYDVVVRLGPEGNLIVREVPHAISLLYPRAWQAAATVSNIVRPVQAVTFSWVAGASYGCMLSCALDNCNY